MPAFIFGGYWMTTDTAFRLITALGIDHSRDDMGKPKTEHRFNEWLVDHDMLQFRVAGLDYHKPEAPSQPIFGICFISRFKRLRQLCEPPLEEGEKEDLALKSWLATMGVAETELFWISRLDQLGIALSSGLQPRKFPTKFVDGKPDPPFYWKAWGDAK